MHRSWIYKLFARYALEGEADLEPRSRRPLSSPRAVTLEIEEEILKLRKQLSEDGFDAGAATISVHLSRKFEVIPSVSSIWRVLKARGFVRPQPKNRPRSSYIRFEADLPNECWQSDMTHWALRDESKVEIINCPDVCSRTCVACVVVRVAKAMDVASVFQGAREKYGIPVSVLSDIHTELRRFCPLAASQVA